MGISQHLVMYHRPLLTLSITHVMHEQALLGSILGRGQEVLKETLP